MHDHRRRNVSIEVASAVAAVLALDQRLDGDRPAVRAGLASSSRIDHHELASGAFSLICEHRGQLSPRGIVYVFRQHASREALDVEVFDRDAAKSIDQIAAELVTEIPAATADPAVIGSERGDALAPDLRASLATSHGALSATKTLRGTLRPARPGDRLAIAHRHKAGQAKVDADAIGRSTFDGLYLDVEDDIPFAGLARKDRTIGLGRHFAVPAHLDLAGHANDAEASGFAQRQPIADAEVCGVVAGAGAEARETSLGPALDAAKERLEALVQPTQHLLLRGAGPATLLGNVAADDRQRHDLLVAFDRDALAVGLDAMFQPSVIEPTEVAQHFAQRRGLRSVRLNSVFVAEDHLPALLAFDVSAHRRFADMPNRSGVIAAAPQRRQSGPQVREFIAQEPRGCALETVDDLGDRAGRVALDEQMHVIWHHLHLVNGEIVLDRHFFDELLEPGIYRRRQHRASILWTPDDVILEAENSPGIACISGSRIGHEAYICVASLPVNCEERARIPPVC